jgi:hypothetical protein
MSEFGDRTVDQAKRIEKYNKEIKLYELQRIDAVRELERAEKQYFEGKREAIFGQKSLAETLIAARQRLDKETGDVSQGVKDLANATSNYEDATNSVVPSINEKKKQVDNVTAALEGMKNATIKATDPADLFGKNVGLSGEALRKLALDAEHDIRASQEARYGFEELRSSAQITADNLSMASQGMVVGFLDATQVVGSFANATSNAMDSWDAVADVRMKMFEQMGYNKQWLQQQRDYERSRVEGMYKNRQQAWENAHAKRTAAQKNYEERKLAGSKSNVQERLQAELGHIETAFTGLKSWWEKTVSGSSDGPQAGEKQFSEQQKSNGFLESILSALREGDGLILTSIM